MPNRISKIQYVNHPAVMREVRGYQRASMKTRPPAASTLLLAGALALKSPKIAAVIAPQVEKILSK